MTAPDSLARALIKTLAKRGRPHMTRPLEEAVTAYREALKEWTRKRAPLQWAGTQNNLGLALWSLGARESGTGKFKEAVATYREVLKELTLVFRSNGLTVSTPCVVVAVH
jgi:hypothetical protein